MYYNIKFACPSDIYSIALLNAILRTPGATLKTTQSACHYLNIWNMPQLIGNYSCPKVGGNNHHQFKQNKSEIQRASKPLTNMLVVVFLIIIIWRSNVTIYFWARYIHIHTYIDNTYP